MNIFQLILDVPTPPDSGQQVADTVAAVVQQGAKAVEKAATSNLTLYLVIAAVALVAIGTWFFLRRAKKNRDQA